MSKAEWTRIARTKVLASNGEEMEIAEEHCPDRSRPYRIMIKIYRTGDLMRYKNAYKSQTGMRHKVEELVEWFLNTRKGTN